MTPEPPCLGCLRIMMTVGDIGSSAIVRRQPTMTEEDIGGHEEWQQSQDGQRTCLAYIKAFDFSEPSGAAPS